MGFGTWLKNVANVIFDPWIETEAEKKEKEAKTKEAETPSQVMQSGRDEEGRSLPAANTSKQQQSSFVQKNVEKTQPQLSYGQERLIQSANPTGSPWMDATLRNYATRQRQPVANIDKSAAGGYNNSVGANHDSPVYKKAQTAKPYKPSYGRAYKSPAYDRQMSYRGLQRNTYDNSKPTGRKRELENALNASSLYNPKEQQEIVKEGLDTAQRRLNSRTYAHYSDAYDKEEEALNYLTDSIVYGSDLDDDTVWSWVTKQGEGEEWLVSLFGEEKREELSKRLQQKLNAVTPEVKQKNAHKYKDYTSKDFDLPDAEKYKKEHNIGGEDEELDTWSTVLDVLQAGLDVAGVIPGVGVAPDLINAAIYAMRGDWINAGLSAAAAIPLVGDAGTIGKYGIKAVKAIDKLADGAKYVDDAIDIGKGMLKYGDEVVEGIVKNGDEVAEVIAKNADNVADASKYTGETVTYRRVQGGSDAKNRSFDRIIVNDNGSITISDKNNNLSVSIDNGEHSQYFKRNRGGDARIIEFEVPKWLDDMIKEYEVMQDGYKKNPLNQGRTAPKRVDISKPGRAYELPPPWAEWLEEYAMNARYVN